MSLPDDNPLPIIGYCDRLSAQPGETVRFMVSCDFSSYRADIVRLVHGDENPKGPGLKEEVINTSVAAEYKGRKQFYPKGSYVLIPDNPRMKSIRGFSIQAWIFPTAPGKHIQGILTSWTSSGGSGFGLFIDEKGCLAVGLRDRSGKSEWVSIGSPLRPHTWYFVACSYDDSSGVVVLHQAPVPFWPKGEVKMSVEKKIRIDSLSPTENPILLAAYWGRAESGKVVPAGHFNGKIDRPTLFSRGLTEQEIDSLRGSAFPKVFGPNLIASWDFSQEVDSDRAIDTSGNGIHGTVINSPKRAVTGQNWTGREIDFKHASDEYGAIHFHDDDLDDCNWDVDFEFKVPEGFKSGTYAARLSVGNHKDYIPFFMRPKKGTWNSKVAFLASTLSYLAYANDHAVGVLDIKKNLGLPDFRYPVRAADKYLMKAGCLLSLYDHHSDDSGVCYASKHRPLLTMRPDYKEAVLGNGKGAPHQFSADLCLLDWMESKDIQYDVITDEDLHYEGTGLLSPYKVIVSGTHPEYWTNQMLDSVETYLKGGGRFMYLGGNGFYWVTSIDSKRPHIVEVRRWGGTQNWRSPVGEYYHSTTGELGGLWRNRGRAPQKLFGVGFTSQGFDRNQPYRRLPDSFDPRASFIFDSIGDDELIGNFDSLIMEFGAGGYEIDRVDYLLGSPSHVLLLATASGYSRSYQHVVEEVDASNSKQSGPEEPLVQSDIVYFEYPNEGGVFSVGSIAWCGCLYYNNYNNNVSRITENVLRKFATAEKL